MSSRLNSLLSSLNSSRKLFSPKPTTKVSLCIATVLLSSCSDGGSSSGGQQAAVVPDLPEVYATGLYTGTVDFMSSGNNISDSNGPPTSLTLEVTGNTGGQQQVRIGFAQFSGTSSIGSNGMFSIPSGEFPLRVRAEDDNSVLTTCRGELLFEGVFEQELVTGSVTSLSPFVCDNSFWGPITLQGMFEATFGSAKLQSGSYDVNIYGAQF